MRYALSVYTWMQIHGKGTCYWLTVIGSQCKPRTSMAFNNPCFYLYQFQMKSDNDHDPVN